MIKNFLNIKIKNITEAAFLVGAMALISALLGLFRDRLLAGKFGAGDTLDVYFAAFRIPDFVTYVLIMGAISAAIIPIFSEYWVRNKKEAWEFLSQILNFFLLSLIAICLILMILTPYLVSFIAPGFQGEKKELTILLTRIMFFSPILLGISNILSGILQFFQRFLVASLAPIMYNLGIISGILFFVPLWGLPGLAWGVVLGGFLHLFIQLPTFWVLGFKYKKILDLTYQGIRKVMKLMLPRALGLAALQANLLVITAIASSLGPGSIAIFNFADRLQALPITLIGSSFAIATFPALSRAWAGGRNQIFLKNFSSTFKQILFLIIPISLLIFLLKTQIVEIILGTGQFDRIDIKLTAASLGLFCLGIPAFTFIPFLTRVFYSFKDTKTPVMIGISSMILNIALAFLFIWLLKFSNFFQGFLVKSLMLEEIENIAVVGLPLALSLSGIFQFSFLFIFLGKKIGELPLREIWNSFQKIIFATILMGILTYLTLRIAANLVNMQTFLGVLTQATLAILTGIFIYILITYLLKSIEIKIIKSSILKQFRKY